MLERYLEGAAKSHKLMWSALHSKAPSNRANSKAASKSKRTLFDSEILSLSSEHAEIIESIINNPRKVKNEEMLFRASEHNFRSDAFH